MFVIVCVVSLFFFTRSGILERYMSGSQPVSQEECSQSGVQSVRSAVSTMSGEGSVTNDSDKVGFQVSSFS